jgi:hypothetical protein
VFNARVKTGEDVGNSFKGQRGNGLEVVQPVVHGSVKQRPGVIWDVIQMVHDRFQFVLQRGK